MERECEAILRINQVSSATFQIEDKISLYIFTSHFMDQLTLTLKTGQQFTGESFGYFGETDGETVFNTGVTGYEETLSDPSYRGQILVITQPLVGNYGIPNDERDPFGILKYFESNQIHVRAILVSEYSKEFSHWKAVKSLGDWLKEKKIPGMSGIDTRALTQILREQGSTLGIIRQDANDKDFSKVIDPNDTNLVDEVSVKEIRTLTPKEKKKTVALIDCGVKNNIIRCFLKRGIEVLQCPWDADVSNLQFDGLFISNGPGDPKVVAPAVGKNINWALKNNVPTFGICLGNQLTALAIGGDTYKLKYGHRGINQPCIEASSGRCYITSQNHGFAVDEKTIPANWELWWTNGNDGTCEGIREKNGKAFTVQFHPEACPGPQDTEFLFDEFIKKL